MILYEGFMKTVYSLFIFFAIGFILDGTSSVAAQHDETAKEQLAEWCALGIDLRSSNPDSSYYYAQQLYRASKPDSYEHNYAQFLAGYYFYRKQQLDTAYLLLDMASNALEESLELGLTVNTKGRILLKNNDFKGAEQLFHESLAIFKRIDRAVNQFYTLNDLGRLFYQQGDYSKALEYYGQAKATALAENMEDRLVRLMSNIVGVYTMLNEYEKALEVAQEANRICDTTNVKDKKIALSALSYAYQKLNQVDSAIYYSEQALVFAKKAGQYFQLSFQLFDTGDLYYLKEDYKAALDMYMEAIELLKDNHAHGNEDQIKVQIALIYEKWNQPDSVIKYAYEAHLYGQAYDIKWSMMKSSEILSRTYASINEPAKAIPYYQLAMQYKDSIYNEDNQKQFADLRVKIETLEKDKEIETLQTQAIIDELERHSIIRLSLAITFILVLSIIVIVLWYKNGQKLQLLRAEELSREIERNKKDLHLQTLHMIRMNNNIQEIEDGLVALKQKVNGASKDVQQLINSIKINKSLEKEWESFNQIFNTTHAGFTDRLRKKCPELSLNDIRLCALLKLNLNNAEIASILNVESKSVVMSKYRLKKKLNLPKDMEVIDFVGTLAIEG